MNYIVEIEAKKDIVATILVVNVKNEKIAEWMALDRFRRENPTLGFNDIENLKAKKIDYQIELNPSRR